jgi:hypothetical protein
VDACLSASLPGLLIILGVKVKLLLGGGVWCWGSASDDDGSAGGGNSSWGSYDRLRWCWSSWWWSLEDLNAGEELGGGSENEVGGVASGVGSGRDASSTGSTSLEGLVFPDLLLAGEVNLAANGCGKGVTGLC